MRGPLLALIMALVTCSVLFPALVTADKPWTEEGIASWYGPGFAGRPTASTEIYNPDMLTAAHKTLPLGSLVRVYNLDNGRNMIVRINDRGPFIEGRVIDLSRASAEVLGCKEVGLANVRLVLLTDPNKPNTFHRAVTHAVNAITPDNWRDEDDGEDLTPGYYVQVGVFANPDNAQKLLEDIDDLGERAYIEIDGDQHRVLVGPFISFSKANTAQRDLERAGIDGFLRLSTR